MNILHHSRPAIVWVVLLAASVTSHAQSVVPPAAAVRPTTLEHHGHVRVDDYFWLRERENPEVIEYLNAENTYVDTMMAHTRELQEKLFEEIKGRIKQTDMSVPYKLDDYMYYTRFEEGKDYPLYCRKPVAGTAAEQVMLDANLLAEGRGFFSVGGREVSQDQNILAFAVDTIGRRQYTLYFKNLTTGELLADVIPSVAGNMAWANDNRTLFYTRQDPVTLRWDKIYRHILGTDPSTDALVYEERDETFNSFVFKTKSKRYLIIGSRQTLSSEYRFLDANLPEGEFTVMQPRERDLEYSADHFGDSFYINTNLDAKNFRLMKTPVTATGKQHWQEVIPHRADVLLTDFEIFKDHLVLSERKSGLARIRIMPWSGTGEHYLEFDEPAYAASVSTNPDFHTPLVRFSYSSMTTPTSVYDYNMNTRERVLLKRDEVLGGYDPANYTTERLNARASDGALIPISIVYRKGLRKDGSNPCLLYGYGSYGASMEAWFSSVRVSLLDRGFVYAIAHIRGGQEMGRYWYEDGKLLKKMNTFTDFIAFRRASYW
jgi:oligopeptidase B